MARNRFERSEYDSVLREDSPYQNGGLAPEKPTPMYIDRDTESLVMWSGDGDIPEVGDIVDLRVPVRYQGVVKEHFFGFGYVGIKVLPYPQYHEALSKEGYGKLPKEGVIWTAVDWVHNYGCDLTTAA
jgi:hypothetical protein